MPGTQRTRSRGRRARVSVGAFSTTWCAVARDGRGIRSRALKVQQPSARERNPDDLRYFTSAHQPTAGTHDRRHDRARLQGGYAPRLCRHVRSFAAFIGRSPNTATAQDLRLFQLHQTRSGMQPPSINSAVSALRFFFTVTLDRSDLARRLTVVPYPRRIPAVLSVEEVTLLLRAATAPKYKAGFATAYGAGLRVSEVIALKAGDIDSKRMLLRVERGKGGKDRHAMLSPQLLELLRVWWREGRRRSLLLPGGWLFPGRNPVEPLSARQFCRAVHAAAQAAGIKKARLTTYAAAQLRHAPPRARCRYSCDSNTSWSRDRKSVV